MSATAESIQLDPAILDMSSPEFMNLLEIRDIDADATSDTTEQDGKSATTSGAVDTTTEQRLPISNKSGTSTIPYAVLDGTRQELSATKQQLSDAMARLRDLEAGSAKRGAVEVPQPGQEIEAEIESAQAQADELEALAASMEEDFPEFGKAVRTLTNRFETQIAALTQRLEGAARVTDEVQRDRQKTAEEVARDAVDNNPYLSTWLGEDPDAWQIAYEHDMKLRDDPKWKDKPIADRFAKVVQYTLVDKPDAKQPASTKQAAPTTENAVDTDARVNAALKAVETYVPNSLSHIPSGESPAPNEQSNLSATQLEAIMEKSTPDQISLMLSRVG